MKARRARLLSTCFSLPFRTPSFPLLPSPPSRLLTSVVNDGRKGEKGGDGQDGDGQGGDRSANTRVRDVRDLLGYGSDRRAAGRGERGGGERRNKQREEKEEVVVVAGPCVIEGEGTIEIAESIAAELEPLPVRWVFKASFDKANRTKLEGGRGVGMREGLDILTTIRHRLSSWKGGRGVPIITDVHDVHQCGRVAEVVDILQIPAFLSRQTDLITAAADTGRVVNIKKGQFMSPADIVHACRKAEAGRVIATERGTSFGYGRLVVDFTSLLDIKRMQADLPVLFDCTHSTQTPGGEAGHSGGNWRKAEALLRCAAAAGYDGLFVETHPTPHTSPSDSESMLPLSRLAMNVQSFIDISAAASHYHT